MNLLVANIGAIIQERKRKSPQFFIFALQATTVSFFVSTLIKPRTDPPGFLF